MKIKLMLDEDVQIELASALKAEGIDAISAQEFGRKGLPDEEQLNFADNNGRVIFTYNVGDFVKLHGTFITQGRDHQGIVVSKQLSISQALKGFLRLVNTLSANEMANRLEFLSNWLE